MAEYGTRIEREEAAEAKEKQEAYLAVARVVQEKIHELDEKFANEDSTEVVADIDNQFVKMAEIQLKKLNDEVTNLKQMKETAMSRGDNVEEKMLKRMIAGKLQEIMDARDFLREQGRSDVFNKE